MFGEAENYGAIILYHNGEVIGEFQTLKQHTVEVHREEDRIVKSGDNIRVISEKGATITLDNIQIDETLMIAPSRRFTIVATGYKYPRNRKPKSKRLIKKWKKKYGKEMTFYNCRII